MQTYRLQNYRCRLPRSPLFLWMLGLQTQLLMFARQHFTLLPSELSVTVLDNPSEESQNIWKWQHKIWDCLPIYCQVDNCQSTAEWLSNKQMTALSIWVNAQCQYNDRVGSSLGKFWRKQTGERKQTEQRPLWHLLESGVGLSRLPLCARERENMGL